MADKESVNMETTLLYVPGTAGGKVYMLYDYLKSNQRTFFNREQPLFTCTQNDDVMTVVNKLNT